MKTEAEVQAAIRQRAGALGILLWRNNRGAMEDATGRVIRFGLGNDSPQVDRRLKSSDLIGQVQLSTYKGGTVDMNSNRMIARPLHVECKAPGWKFPTGWRELGSPNHPALVGEHHADKVRTLAQWRWLKLHHDAGALAGFAQSIADFERILTGELVLP